MPDFPSRRIPVEQYLQKAFYIFFHETQFDEYEKDKTKLKNLQEKYEQVKNKLEELLSQVTISEYTRCTIIDMSNKVLGHIAAKYVLIVCIFKKMAPWGKNTSYRNSWKRKWILFPDMIKISERGSLHHQ